MRIVYVLTTLAVGGAERQVLAIARRMAARGHVVEILVLRPAGEDDFDTELPVTHLDILKRPLSAAGGLFRALEFLRAFRPDVIHSHNFHGNMLARMTRLFYRKAKLVSTIHNIYEGGTSRMLAYRFTDSLATLTTAVSEAVRTRYVSQKAVSPSKILVITNGIDLNEFSPDPSRRAALRPSLPIGSGFAWIIVARLTPAKDIPNLIQAFTEVLKVEPEAHLLVAGEVPYDLRYEESAMDSTSLPMAVQERIFWMGLCGNIAGLLDAADGFVLSSAWEGFPLAIGEAMAMEKPIVATDVGGVRELVGDAGMLVPSRDPVALAKAMLDVMQTTSERRADMGHVARERIRNNFSLDAKADEWEALYRSVSCHGASEAAVVP
jgi:glycosyltransferase involved in cell wall biosynthesis